MKGEGPKHPLSLPLYLFSHRLLLFICTMKSWTSGAGKGQRTPTLVCGDPTPFAIQSNSFSEHSFYFSVSLCGKSCRHHYSHVTREISQGHMLDRIGVTLVLALSWISYVQV